MAAWTDPSNREGVGTRFTAYAPAALSWECPGDGPYHRLRDSGECRSGSCGCCDRTLARRAFWRGAKGFRACDDCGEQGPQEGVDQLPEELEVRHR